MDKDLKNQSTTVDSPLTPPPEGGKRGKKGAMEPTPTMGNGSMPSAPPKHNAFIKPISSKTGDISLSSNAQLRKDVIEYVEDRDDEELPECQMYDTGRLDDSDNAKYSQSPLEPSFDPKNLQDSIYIAKQNTFNHFEDERNSSSQDEHKQANSRVMKDKEKKSRSAEKRQQLEMPRSGGMTKSKSVGNLQKSRTLFPMAGKVNNKVVHPISKEEQRQKWIKSLPQAIRHIAHLDFVKDRMITDKQKVDYYKKYNIETKEKEWPHPKSDQEKSVALELIIDHLYNNKVFRNDRLSVKGLPGGKGKTLATSPRRGGGMFGLCNNNRQNEQPIPYQKKMTPQINPPIDSIKWLIKEAQGIFRKEPNLLEIEAPVKICGDFHGQFHDMLQMFTIMGGPPGPVRNDDDDDDLDKLQTTNYSDDGKQNLEEEISDQEEGQKKDRPENRYLLMGDYVDRGQNSTELICLLLAWKIKFPKHLHLLRGNHETQAITKIYGFFDEVKRRYNPPLWRSFTNMFNYMPVTALVDERILCMHGGLSPDLMQKDLSHINTRIARPCDVPDYGLMCDLLWSDPADKDAQANRRQHIRIGGMRNMPGWTDNDRGVSYKFNENVVKQFCDRHDIDLICRAHQVVEDGYQFYADRRLVTVFSAPNYCGQFDNDASILQVEDNLCCKFVRFEQQDTKNSSEPSMGQMMPSPGQLQRYNR